MNYFLRIITISLVVTNFAVISTQAQEFGGDNRREMFKQKMQERLQQMDTDGNGAISKSEFMAQAESRFSKMDSDGDGQITKEERSGMRDKFKQLREGKGAISEQFP